MTVIPVEFNSRHAASAWSRSWPATKRVAKRWAREEVSIHLRKSLRRERKIKKLRTKYRLAPFGPGSGRERAQSALIADCNLIVVGGLLLRQIAPARAADLFRLLLFLLTKSSVFANIEE